MPGILVVAAFLSDSLLLVSTECFLARLAVRPETLAVLEWGPHDPGAGLRTDEVIYPFENRHPIRLVFKLPAGPRFHEALDAALARVGEPPYALVRIRFRLEDSRGRAHVLDLLLAARGGRFAVRGVGFPRWREARRLLK